MNRLFILLTVLVLIFSCKDQKAKNNEVADSSLVESSTNNTKDEADVKFPVYDFNAFEPLLHKDDGITYIVNFWATWCQPCIEEMPHFERVNAEQKENNVKVILVSLDMPNMWKSRLEPYVEKKDIQSEVVILDDPKQNVWIPKVSEEWGGAIPATLIYNKDKRSFYERGFTYEELNEELSKFTK
ncbi:TlpA family protein disulfide reductase [Flagellimonas zhangzhouensis]|uniref:Thiol-disulfide isomerase or thioredoxin n=1 Tax=Flagellimonas zhangzhouensis TaxID=1073328 RepID=A0A1H2YZY5_9FLAO|nr:TlpA family protein disulfide reductase [Allomuricauda zhangzhouensis]SDR04281.1 Thiol-disulfide isomerase or thioredoxin [Allomuricauda zhangzhouensis]SDX10666.1 Thiol-disulfide isomerase or thioredoxin [Allomuricauda zhangzhouensis]